MFLFYIKGTQFILCGSLEAEKVPFKNVVIMQQYENVIKIVPGTTLQGILKQ